MLEFLDFGTIRLYVSYFFLLFGVVDVLIGMIGLIRLPDVYNRLHATTKIATTGAFFVLLSILIQDGFTSFGFKAIAIGIFLIITSPVAGHVIARAAYNINIPPCDQTLYDAYCGKRQGDHCDDCDFHEGSYVYVDLGRREQDQSDHFKEHLTEQFSEELSGLVREFEETTPDSVQSPEDDDDDGEELITGSESPDKAAAVFDEVQTLPPEDVPATPEQTEAFEDVVSQLDPKMRTELEEHPELSENLTEEKAVEKEEIEIEKLDDK